MDLKAETVGLAVALELPMIVIDVQRAGPSTGMPTKTEAADLLMALYGRHGESPLPIVAPATPGDCFQMTIEAVRIAVRYRTPVIILSDTFLSNSSEPWRVPNAADIAAIDPKFSTEPNTADGDFLPYLRNEDLARPWALPGTPGLRHRIGGLEKEDGTGQISYDPDNHEHMTHVRADKVARIDVPPLEVNDQYGDAELLVVGWGSTYGPMLGAARRVRLAGYKVALAHIRHLNPLPPNTEEVLRRYKRVLVPETNMGQLVKLLRAEYLIDCEPYNRVRGLPLSTEELEKAMLERVE